MNSISFSWDKEKRSIGINWNGLLSLGWKDGKGVMKILGIPLPYGFKQKMGHLPLRWIYLKEALTFFPKWKLKKIDATLSHPDPMVNGTLYGWTSAIETIWPSWKGNVTINFLGENRFKGEVTISPKIMVHNLRKWILPMIFEMRKGSKNRRD